MPRRNSRRLTQSVVTQLGPKEGHDYTLFDTELPGFGVRVRPSGAKTFVIMYRTAQGRQRKLTLGRYGPLTVNIARDAARKQLGEISGGIDPLQQKIDERNVISIAELCDRYFADAIAGKVTRRGKAKGAVTLNSDRGRIERHIKPLLGKRIATDVTVVSPDVV